MTCVPRHGKSLICPADPSVLTSTVLIQRRPNSVAK
jgi:hypothetical protein